MMEANPDASDAIARLKACLDLDDLPERARAAGGKLVERLSSPIRVALLGHPHSGKSELLNLIAGERIVPADAALPTLELRHGDARRLTVIAADGTETPADLAALKTIGRDDAAAVRVEAPIPVLQKISLLEVVTRGSAEDERAGVTWAADRADIVLWCTQEFTPAEQWLWSAMPDRLKDHGFLVLTKADELIRDDVLGDRIAGLEDIVAEEFHSLVPVATLQGQRARAIDGGARDDAALAASGAKALVGAILRHVEQGRRADLDGALMFVSRFGQALTEAEIARHRVAAPPAPQAAPAANAPAPASAPEAPADNAMRAMVETALATLRERAANLNRALDAAEADEDALIGGCVDLAETLAEMLNEETAAPGDRFAGVQHDALEVSEMLLLMQLESGDGRAADAATLLLQLRRSLSQSLAA